MSSKLKLCVDIGPGVKKKKTVSMVLVKLIRD